MFMPDTVGGDSAEDSVTESELEILDSLEIKWQSKERITYMCIIHCLPLS